MNEIMNETENDVLCGRGGATLRHPGNKRYRDLIDSNKETYRISTKEEKTAISRSIVATIRNQQGRFLAERKKLWYDIGDAKATEKTSQALREKPPELRQRMTDDDYMKINADDLLDNVDLELAMSDQRYNDGTLNHSEKTYHIAKTLPSNSQQSENNDSYYSSHHHQHQHQHHHLNPPSFASTNASDSMTNSFDGGTSDSTEVVSDLMKAQRQIFAALTTSTSPKVLAVTAGRTPTATACIKSEQPHYPDNDHDNQYFEYENENEDENNREVTLNNDTFEDMMWGDDYNEDDDSDIISLGFLCSVMSSPTTTETTTDPHYLLAIRRTRRWTL